MENPFLKLRFGPKLCGRFGHRRQKKVLWSPLNESNPDKFPLLLAKLSNDSDDSTNFQEFVNQSGGPGNFFRNFGIPARQNPDTSRRWTLMAPGQHCMIMASQKGKRRPRPGITAYHTVSVKEKFGTQIPFPGAGKNGHDLFATMVGAAGQAQRSPHCGPGGDAAEDAFPFGHLSCG